MPSFGSYGSSSSGLGKPTLIPQAEPTLAERVLSPLKVLNRPQVAATQFLTGHPFEALKAAIPFVPYEEKFPSEAMGIENPWAALGVDAVFDPFNFFAIGKLNVAGKIEKAIEGGSATVKGLERLQKVRQGLESADKLAETLKYIERVGGKKLSNVAVKSSVKDLTNIIAEETLKLDKYQAELLKLPADAPRRSLFTAEIPFTGIRKDFGKFPSKKLAYTKGELELLRTKEKLESKIQDLKNTSDLPPLKVEKLKIMEEQLQSVSEELSKTNNPILSISTTNKLYKVLDSIKNKFVNASENSVVKTLRSLLDTETFSQTQELDEATKLVLEKAENLIQGAKNPEEAMKRLSELAQYRQVVLPGSDELLDTSLKSRLEQATLSYNKKTLAAEKAGRYDVLETLKTKYEKNLSKIRDQATEARLHVKEMAKRLGPVSPEEMEFVTSLNNTYDHMLYNLRLHGVEIDPITSNLGRTSYVHRIWSDDALNLKSKNPSLYAKINRELNIRFGPAIQRKLKPELDLFEANDYLRNKFGLNFDFYNTNVIEGLMKYRREYIKKINTSEYGLAIVSHFGQKTPVGGVRADDFLKRLEIKPLDKKSVEGLRIPKYIADDATRADKLLKLQVKWEKGHPHLTSFLTWLDAVPNKLARLMYTSSLLAPYASFATRNAVGLWWNSALGGVSNPKYISEAWRILWKNANKAELTADEAQKLKRFIDLRGLRAGQLRDWEQTTDLLGRETSNVIDKYYNRVTEKGFDLVKSVSEKYLGTTAVSEIIDAVGVPMYGRRFNSFVDDSGRFAHYLGKLDQGATPIEAMKSVNKYMFDYMDLTPFEQRVMRPTFLFYTWMRKNLPLQVNAAIEDPKILRLYQHVTQMGEDDRPDYLRTGTSIKVPWADNLYVGSMGLPIEDLFMTNVGNVAPISSEQISEVFRNVFSKLSPVPKAIVTYTTGREPYTGKPTKDLTWLEHLQNAFPIGRLARTGRLITDEEKTWSTKALDLFTGLKFYAVQPGRARTDELRRKILRTGKVSTFPVLAPARNLDDDEKEVAKKLISYYQKEVAKNRRKK